MILENREGHFALQLRANISSIGYPNQWGLFGGHIEEGENAEQAALREVQEELSCVLDPTRMRHLQTARRVSDKLHFIFHYRIGKELDSARLTEGQRFGFFTFQDIDQGEIEGGRVVEHHLHAIRDYWRMKG